MTENRFFNNLENSHDRFIVSKFAGNRRKVNSDTIDSDQGYSRNRAHRPVSVPRLLTVSYLVDPLFFITMWIDTRVGDAGPRTHSQSFVVLLQNIHPEGRQAIMLNSTMQRTSKGQSVFSN